jgi:hypothetical protein
MKDKFTATRRSQTLKAKRDGIIKPPDDGLCQICGKKPVSYSMKYGKDYNSALVAHHYNGYDNYLDIWWICRRCNYKLVGKHDGSLTIEDARRLTYIAPIEVNLSWYIEFWEGELERRIKSLKCAADNLREAEEMVSRLHLLRAREGDFSLF